MLRGLLALAIVCSITTMPIIARAQAPVAQFSANNTSGCSPVVVQFTDQSTGSPTSWSWDLGNGGTSSLQNPSASYVTPGTYTVILTATNSNGSTKDTGYITVYTSPTVAFSADTTTTCGTKTVTFTNSTTPGASGSVTYLWDFGDGDSSTAVSPTHTYAQSGNYTISLVVTNSNGCTNSLTKSNYIHVLPKPTSSFTANNTSSCNAPFQVSFTNNSSNAASYSWDFGDGGSSTATSPSHTYTSSGTYTVKLISTGPNGCTDTLTRSSYIVIGQVVANFTATTACVNKNVTFTNTTTPGPGISRTWSFGNGATDTALNPVYKYTSTGTYTVTLIEQYANNCNDTVSKSVTVNSNPTAQFASSDTIGCTVPFMASFTNGSTGATSYSWSSGSGSNSTATNPTFTYNSLGIYNVSLTATNAAGCTSTVTKHKYVKLEKPDASLSISDTAVCANEAIQMTASLASPLYATNYRWNFGDGSSIVNCSSCNTQSHSYSSTGTYNVQLIVTTTSGCYDTVTKTIHVRSKPTAAFSGSPLTICPDASVTFTNSSTGATSYSWNFGDGRTSDTTSPTHFYDDPGTYTIRLIASNDGCLDTLTKTGYVTVNLPLAEFTPTFSCSARLSYTFVDSSVSANTYYWNFGDGNTSTTSGTVSHTYSAAGTYAVTLAVYNSSTGCSDTFRKYINAKPIVVPSFSTNDTLVCPHALVTATRAVGASDYTYLWYLGTEKNPNQGINPAWYVAAKGALDLKLIVTDSAGCKDSVIKTAYVRVGGEDVDISASPANVCKLAPVLLTDIGTKGAFPIVSRYWDFGDGTQRTTSTDTVYHSFNNTGPFDIKLVITDSLGCKDSITKSGLVYSNKPTAQFYSNDTVVCAGDTVKFNNNSGGTSFTSLWDFGDGSSGTITSPEHKYTSLGTYTVKLNIVDSFGCKDSAEHVNYIHVQKPTADFALSDTVGDCPPLTVYTTNNSTNSSTYLWTFGNNNQSTNTNPSITYTYPGVYNVKLVATNIAGCKDSTTKTVTVNGPTGSFSYTPSAGCTPLQVQFTAVSSNTTAYIWDMNNGYTHTTSSGNFSYTYTQTGQYVPNVILSDGASCQVPLQNVDTIVVDKMQVDFTYTTAGNLCNNDTVYFNDSILYSLSTVTGRSWDFGDGSTSTSEDPAHYYNMPGTYQVRLIVTNNNGCMDTVTKTITIHNLPTVTIASAGDSICPGQPSGITLTASGANSYTWTPTSGLSCTNCANPDANPQVNTTYIVTGTDTNGCMNYDTITINIKPKPALSISNDTTICSGQFTPIQVSGAYTYSWTPTGGLSCTSCTNPDAAPSTTTGYTVIGTNASGCKDTADVTVTIIPSPVVSAGAGNTICFADSTKLVATGADNYTWTPTSGLTCSTCDSTYAHPSSTTAYTVIGTKSNGCKDTSAVTVTVNPLPTVTASDDTSICIGNSASLLATGATSYTWSPTTGLSCTNCANPTAGPAATTTYIVAGTDGNSCTDYDTVVVTVNPLPNVNAGSDKTICAGFGETLTATGATSYTWTPATGLSCSNCTNPTATPTTTTTYTLTGTDANTCVNTDTVTVFVNPQPTVSGGADKNICPADSTQLTATGAVTYQWSPTTGLSCSSCDNPKASPVSTTTYTVIGTDSNGCKDTATVKVTVNPPPVVSAGSNTSICYGSNTILLATGAASYTWTPATGLSCTNCANPTANPTSTTTYTVIGANGNSCMDTATVTVTVNPLPNVDAGNYQTICVYDSAQIQASGAATYVWSPATGLACNNCQSTKASPATTTTYTVTGTDTNGCVHTDTVTVIVHPQPIVSAGSNKTICNGDSVQLQATGAISYSWSPATGLSCTSCVNPKASPSTTTTYTVVGTNANGCKDTSTVTVTVNALPVVSAGANKSICYGSSTTLTATGATSYTWSPATGLSCTNCTSPVANPTATITYILTGTNGNGCTDTAHITITVNPLPNVNAGNAKSICLNDSTQLQASGATSYTWTPASGLSCTNCTNPKASPPATTTYTVSGTDGNGCVNTDTVTIIIKALPNVNAGNDPTICNVDTVQLHATGAISYTWAPGVTLTCTNCSNPRAYPSGTTIYTVAGTGANSCVGYDTVVVNVNPLPVVRASKDTTICFRDSVQLNATGAQTYTWTPASWLSCKTCQSPVSKPADTVTYTVTGTDTNGCKNKDSVKINVKKLPVMSASAARTTFCDGDTTLLHASGATSYKWSPSGNVACDTCANTIAKPTISIRYIVTGTENGCSDTASVFINLRFRPTVVAGPPVSYCIGGSGTLHASGADTFKWSPATALSCTNCASPVANPASTTKYVVTGTDTNGCVNSDSVTVTVHSLPKINAGTDQAICIGDSVRLTASGADSFTWSPAAGLSCTQCSRPYATTSDTSTFLVTGKDVNGCTGTDSVTVTAMHRNKVSWSKDDSICTGESVPLFASGGTSYTWIPNEGLSDPFGNNITATPVATSNYRVIIKQGDCYTDTGYTTITVFDLPKIDAGPDQEIKGSNQVKIETKSSGVAKYEWSPADGLSCTDCVNPIVTTTTTRSYHVKATSKHGCVAEDDVTVFVTCGADQLFIANTFTPNNDGVNDRFFPQGKGLTQIQRFSVYNRWGELVYDAQNIPLNDPAYGWDGTYKAEHLEPDVFVYIIRAVCDSGRPIEVKGDISLVR